VDWSGEISYSAPQIDQMYSLDDLVEPTVAEWRRLESIS